MKKRTTINDLAKALGLSPTLISMVLNGKGTQNKISVTTQKKVIDTARKLNYTPNQNARALRTGKTYVIGLIVPDISNAFYSRLARNFEDLLWQKGYRLIMGSTDESPESEKKLLRLFTDQNVDGIIAASTFTNAKIYDEMRKAGQTIVLFDRIFSRSGIPSVSVQNEKGAMLAVEQFIQQGRKKIGYLTLTPQHISPLYDRFEGYKQAIKKHRLKTPAQGICEIKFDDLDTRSEKIFAGWLQKNRDMDAILVANNRLTFRLLKFLKAHPDLQDRFGIISFDDHMGFEISSPAISVISQPIEDIAQKTVETLMASLENHAVVTESVLPVSFISRGSHLRHLED